MKTFARPLLALFALLALLLAPAALLAQELPVATPVDPATLAAPPDPALPTPSLLIAVLVPLVIAGLKKAFPKIPGALLPVLAPVLGGLIEAVVTALGHDGGGVVAGAVAGAAGTGVREIVDQNRKRLPGAAAGLCFLCGLLFVVPGCTSFVVEQGDASPERTITFKLRGRAWFSGSQAIANLKAMQTDKSQSFGTDSINNRGPTNAVAVIEAATKLVEAAKP